MRKKIKRWTRELKSYNLPSRCTLFGLLQCIEETVADVPAEHRGMIEVELTGYGDESPYLEFEFRSDETDAEMNERVERERQSNEVAAIRKRTDELAQLAALKAKYER